MPTGQPGGVGTTALGIEETARRAARYRWVSSSLFEVLGGWVSTAPEPEAKVLLSAHAAHCAWHASLWDDRLPGTYGIGAGTVTPPALEGAVEAVRSVESTAGRLAAAHRVVLPRLAVVYGDHLALANEVADGPAVRALRLSLADVVDDVRAGERLLQALLVDRTAVDRASAAAAQVEVLLVEAGGLLA